VWSQVRSQNLTYYNFTYYGSIWDYAWISFYDFFEQIGIVKDNQNYIQFKKLLQTNIYDMILQDKICFVSDMPTKITRDEQHRLHNEGDYAIEFANGYGQYYIHGVAVTEKIVKTPEKLTKQDWLKEENLEVRRVIQERMPDFAHKIGGKVIGKHPDPHIGEVVEVDISPDPEGKAWYLKAQDWSTDRVYYLWIEHNISDENKKYWADMSDPMTAQAWTYSDEEKGVYVSKEDMEKIYERIIIKKFLRT
jgi:hypothetical protein